jgi:transcriptional regulator with XRE-family HTH domain
MPGIWLEVGPRIREHRKKNGLTIERLSEMLDVSTSFVGLVEKGDCGMSVENILALADIFKITVDYLLTGNSESAPANDNKNRFEMLETYLYDYSEEEVVFLLETAKFLKSRVDVKKVTIKKDKSAPAE